MPRPEPTTPEGSFVWFRNFVPLRGGGYHHAWRIAKIDGDNVLVFGHAKPIRRTSRYFHLAIWGPMILPPPVEDEGGSTLALAKTGNRQQRKKQQDEDPVPEKLLAVARRITLAFVESSSDLGAMYAAAPEKLEEVIQRVAGLIRAAME